MTMLIETTRTATRWELDPANSAVDFQARHLWGLLPVDGHFSRFTGSYRVDDDHRTIEMTIDAASIDTGIGKRDRHLRSADFFAVDAHPHVRFTSNDVTVGAAGMLRVAGRLEVAGTSVPLAFDATIRELGEELEIEATTSVDHHLFGMPRSPLGMLRPLIKLHVRARLHLTSDATAEEQS